MHVVHSSHSLLPAPLEPSRNTMARSPDATSYNHGSLSDYSDYDSDSEGGHEPRHHSCEPSHGAGDNPSGSGHVPKIGAQHSLLDDDEEEDEGGDDGDDPFADPFYGEPAQPEIYRPAAGRQGSGVV